MHGHTAHADTHHEKPSHNEMAHHDPSLEQAGKLMEQMADVATPAPSVAPDETNVEDKKLAKLEEKTAGVVSVLPLLLDSPVVHHEWVGPSKQVHYMYIAI